MVYDKHILQISSHEATNGDMKKRTIFQYKMRSTIEVLYSKLKLTGISSVDTLLGFKDWVG
jgi:hypothetical protein